MTANKVSLYSCLFILPKTGQFSIFFHCGLEEVCNRQSIT